MKKSLTQTFTCAILTLSMMVGTVSCGTDSELSKDIEVQSNSESSYISSESELVSETTSTHVHAYSDATCTLAKTCSCGEIAGIPLGHNYSDATCTSPQICSRCGETNGAPLGHDYLEATCTEAEKCSACGETNGEPLGHDYVDNTCSHCGQIDPDSIPIALSELHVIDYGYGYKYFDDILYDTFGNTYTGYHRLKEAADKAYVIFNLDYKFSRFTCDIVVSDDRYSDLNGIVEIYIDDVLLFEKTGITKTTGKIHVDINVENGQQLKIVAMDSKYSYCDVVCLVNAQLTK